MNFLTALAAIGGDSLLSTIILIVIIVVVLIVIFSFVPIGLWTVSYTHLQPAKDISCRTLSKQH